MGFTNGRLGIPGYRTGRLLRSRSQRNFPGPGKSVIGGWSGLERAATSMISCAFKLYQVGAGTSEIRRWLIGRELFEETA